PMTTVSSISVKPAWDSRSLAVMRMLLGPQEGARHANAVREGPLLPGDYHGRSLIVVGIRIAPRVVDQIVHPDHRPPLGAGLVTVERHLAGADVRPDGEVGGGGILDGLHGQAIQPALGRLEGASRGGEAIDQAPPGAEAVGEA